MFVMFFMSDLQSAFFVSFLVALQMLILNPAETQGRTFSFIVAFSQTPLTFYRRYRVVTNRVLLPNRWRHLY